MQTWLFSSTGAECLNNLTEGERANFWLQEIIKFEFFLSIIHCHFDIIIQGKVTKGIWFEN